MEVDVAKFLVEIDDSDFALLKEDVLHGWEPNWLVIEMAVEQAGFPSVSVMPMHALRLGAFVAGIARAKVGPDVMQGWSDALDAIHEEIQRSSDEKVH
jgi:hypothetical protein